MYRVKTKDGSFIHVPGFKYKRMLIVRPALTTTHPEQPEWKDDMWSTSNMLGIQFGDLVETIEQAKTQIDRALTVENEIIRSLTPEYIKRPEQKKLRKKFRKALGME